MFLLPCLDEESEDYSVHSKVSSIYILYIQLYMCGTRFCYMTDYEKCVNLKQFRTNGSQVCHTKKIC